MFFVRTTQATLLSLFLLGYLPAQAAPHHATTLVKKQRHVVAINSADAKSLAELKGIGPKKAQAIVDYRKKHGKFSSLNQLAQVKGMSAKSVARLAKENAMVRDAPR